MEIYYPPPQSTHTHTLFHVHIPKQLRHQKILFELHTESQMPHVSVLDTCIPAALQPLFHFSTPAITKILDPTSDTTLVFKNLSPCFCFQGKIKLWCLNALLHFNNDFTSSLDLSLFGITRHLISCAPGHRELPLLQNFSLSLPFHTVRNMWPFLYSGPSSGDGLGPF